MSKCITKEKFVTKIFFLIMLNEILITGSGGRVLHNRQNPLSVMKVICWWVLTYANYPLTVCFYHVTYAFHSESTLYSCLDVKELLTWNRCDIWSLSDCNGTWNHNHLVHKWTLNHIVKLARCKRVLLQSLNYPFST